ncbi:citrulline utilization hydrolase CtlX [Veronia pacifica]|uniref:Amidinotransferase n=1 Tax=Veronia pacifica TaxID=1080227 RepID=A0A1C3E945_9GAMM|nr:arginine deiminase-related protein [Veronia pacifica]ODA29754.1 amidinotransferase [Veronia pacifica]
MVVQFSQGRHHPLHFRPHTAQSVIMVPPVDFAFNTEASADNEFQNKPSIPGDQVRTRATSEFNAMVNCLSEHGIDVVVMNYQPEEQSTPDAVFPNNWFSTSPNGEITLYPMACENRRREVRQEPLKQVLNQHGYDVINYDELVELSNPDTFLESTGVMVMDHVNRVVYAAISARCDQGLLSHWAAKTGYKVIAFDTHLSSGSPVYHTNVMMSVGETFAVICDDIIDRFERRRVLDSLSSTKEVVTITESQMASFCGNILQLQNQHGERFIAMSQSAFDAFTDEQKTKLSAHGTLLPFDVSTIESIGGGSVRCMLAENFLPRVR